MEKINIKNLAPLLLKGETYEEKNVVEYDAVGNVALVCGLCQCSV